MRLVPLRRSYGNRLTPFGQLAASEDATVLIWYVA